MRAIPKILNQMKENENSLGHGEYCVLSLSLVEICAHVEDFSLEVIVRIPTIKSYMVEEI